MFEGRKRILVAIRSFSFLSKQEPDLQADSSFATLHESSANFILKVILHNKAKNPVPDPREKF